MRMKKSEAPASVNTVKRMKMKKSEALAVDVDRRLLGHGGILPGCWPGGGRAPRRLPVILSRGVPGRLFLANCRLLGTG